MYELGFRGKPCPISKETINPEANRMVLAWAQGVWHRQASPRPRLALADFRARDTKGV